MSNPPRTDETDPVAPGPASPPTPPSPAGPREPSRTPSEPGPAGDPLTAMTPRFNLFFRWFARRFFGHFSLGEETVERLRELERRGAVVYVMRYSSRLDYFLFNALFVREKLRLSRFANGLRYYYYRPFLQALRVALFRPRGRPREVQLREALDHAGRLSRAGSSLFLFLRTERLRSFLRGRRRRPPHDELDLLTGVVKAVWDSDRPVSVVPLSVFWRKGPRAESRFLNLSYGSLTRPSDALKVSSFLATYRDLSVKCGEPIDLTGFIAEHREEGPDRVARKVRRSLLTYLYREEKVVEGPTLRSRQRVCEGVLSAPAVRAEIERRAAGRRGGAERAHVEAERIFREIAAHMNSTFLAALAFLVSAVFRRMFASIEVEGLERVAEDAKRHPIVLVPNHRSYFDFLLVSWLFYKNYMVPPHIAARENMAFGPFGFIFRRAGAFFLRRSFDDPLYKEIFRAYVAYLVREGFTQEFFIEGGRSRTGKTLAPRLGMLTWDVEAFLASPRRDLLFVPVSITYERLVEESAMVDELQGAAKTEESVLGLVRARKYLQRRFGSTHVAFGEPMSLAEALGDRRETLARADDEATLAERRHFVEELGLRIVERINWTAVANATSVAACAVLGAPHRGMRRADLIERMRQIVDLLRLQNVRLTPALLADRSDFRESIAFLRRSDLLRSSEGQGGEILYYEESHRRALDLYRNAIAHYLAAPSVLARRLLCGATLKELAEDWAAWHEILYQEYFPPAQETFETRGRALLEHFARHHWVEDQGERWGPTRAGEPVLRWLAEQTRGVVQAYRAACTVAADPALDVDRAEFLKRAALQFEHAQLLGEADRVEAANDTTFQNALDLLVRRGIVQARAVESGGERRSRRGRARPRTTTRFAPGERADALPALLERLSGACTTLPPR